MIVPAIALVLNAVELSYAHNRDGIKQSDRWIATGGAIISVALSVTAIWAVYARGIPKLFESKHFEALPLAGRMIKKVPLLRYGPTVTAGLSNWVVFEVSALAIVLAFMLSVDIRNKPAERCSPAARMGYLIGAVAISVSYLSLVYFRPISARHLSKFPFMERVLSKLSPNLQGLISRVGYLTLGSIFNFFALGTLCDLRLKTISGKKCPKPDLN